MPIFSADSISQLLARHLRGELTADEQVALSAWLKAEESNAALLERLDDPRQLQALMAEYYSRHEEMEAQLKAAIPGLSIDIAPAAAVTPAPVRIAHRVHFLKRGWFRYAAAVIMLIGAGIYFWLTRTYENDALVQHNQPVRVQHDAAPGFNQAVLTLSNGEQIKLDSAASETIQDGTLSIENNNGQLIYQKGEVVSMNTMTTPKGGQYQLTLSDGTKVWLNAASSITYPTAFTGHRRIVTVKGEAYFEVTKNASQPFIVKTAKEEITVLGTQFNVNAYEDEVVMKTSLLEGSIKIGGKILKPGQAYADGKIIATNIGQDVAWKNGAFSFNDADIRTIMRQLSRWYDVEVKYEGELPTDHLTGEIGRNLTLSQVMNLLSQTKFKYTIHNKEIIILPNNKK